MKAGVEPGCLKETGWTEGKKFTRAILGVEPELAESKRLQPDDKHLHIFASRHGKA